MIKFAGLFLLLFLAACQPMNMPTRSRMGEELPDEQTEMVRIVSMKLDKVDYVLTANQIDRYYNKRLLNATTVNIVTYDKNGVLRSTIKADFATVNEAENRIYARGNVKLTSPNGALETQNLTWDRNLDEVFAPGAVILTRNGNVLNGNELRTDSNLNNAEMKSVTAAGTANEKDIDW